MAFAVAFVAFVRGATRLPCIMVGGKQRGRATRDDDDGPKKVSLVPQLLLAIDWLATFFELNRGWIAGLFPVFVQFSTSSNIDASSPPFPSPSAPYDPCNPHLYT